MACGPAGSCREWPAVTYTPVHRSPGSFHCRGSGWRMVPERLLDRPAPPDYCRHSAGQLILAAEILDVSFLEFRHYIPVSVSAAFCFAAGLTAELRRPGPPCGGITATRTASSCAARRSRSSSSPRPWGSTLLEVGIDDAGESTIGSVQNLLAGCRQRPTRWSATTLLVAALAAVSAPSGCRPTAPARSC